MGVGLCRRLRPNIRRVSVATGSSLTGMTEPKNVALAPDELFCFCKCQRWRAREAKTSLLVFIAKPQGVACEACQTFTIFSISIHCGT